jgi:hypothetical protein
MAQRKRIQKPSGYGKGKIRPRETRRRIEEGELPYVAPVPKKSSIESMYPIKPPLTVGDQGIFYGERGEPMDVGVYDDFFGQQRGRDKRIMGGRQRGGNEVGIARDTVSPRYLFHNTTGPIPQQDEVLRQLREYEDVTADPIYELIRRHLQERQKLQDVHTARGRQPTPLTSDIRRRRK